MSKEVLVFTPQSKGVFKKNPLYVIPIFAKTIGLCIKYLAQFAKKPISLKETDDYIDIFYKINLESSKTSLYVTGQEYIDKNESYIYMSNHESWMDIPAMFGAVKQSLRMISKIGLMKVPFIGKAMDKADFIFIDRKNRTSAIRQLDKAKEKLAKGISIWIAPEGTRTRTKKIGDFKKGGFHLACQLRKKIVPVFIEGAYEVMPPDSMYVYPNRKITVHFLKPIETKGYDRVHVNELMKKVREIIVTKKKECEKREGL